MTTILGREVTFNVSFVSWPGPDPDPVYGEAQTWESAEKVARSNRWKEERRKDEGQRGLSTISPDVVQLTGRIVSVFHDRLHVVENGRLWELALNKARLVEKPLVSCGSKGHPYEAPDEPTPEPSPARALHPDAEGRPDVVLAQRYNVSVSFQDAADGYWSIWTRGILGKKLGEVARPQQGEPWEAFAARLEGRLRGWGLSPVASFDLDSGSFDAGSGKLP